MQAGHRQSAAGFDLAGDPFLVDRALGFQGNEGGLRIGLVLFLDRGLRAAEFSGGHSCSLLDIKYLSDVMGRSAYVTTTLPRQRWISAQRRARCGRASGPARSA